MGIIPDLDDMFEAAEVGGTYVRVEDGTHEGTITAAAVRESKKPWRDAEFYVCITTPEGGEVHHTVEVAPLVGKDGNISTGKVKWLKWQLQACGFDGKLSELESQAESLMGNRVKFEISSEESTNINEKTGKPYINRDIVVKDYLGSAFDGPVVVDAAPVATPAPAPVF